MAGIVVGVVALPLSMALAIAAGVPPQHGLYTAIVAGLVIAPLGGSVVQVSGPTAAFVVILAPIAARFGLGGLLVATLAAGTILLAMGAAGMGQFIEYVPYPVTTGFTVGIAVVIGTLQLKDFLGLTVERMPEHYLERLAALLKALPTIRLADVAIGVFTLAVLLLWPRVNGRVPAPIVALTLAALAATAGRGPGPASRWLPSTRASRTKRSARFIRASPASPRARCCRGVFPGPRLPAADEPRPRAGADAGGLRDCHAGCHRVAALGDRRRRDDAPQA
jgi:MFS superfamily sulfate permease-like transporter